MNVDINELKKISRTLIDKYFNEPNIYSLLTLSLITVTTFSNKKAHLDVNVRISIAIDIIPDLLTQLAVDKVITEDIRIKLEKDCQRRKKEFPAILENYLYAASGLHVKNKKNNDKSNKNSSCIMV